MKTGDIVASRYRLEQKLGMGGMGTVWSAQHTQTGRYFALKIMHSTVAANEDSRQRFLKEAKASARIDHPNVIDVLDVGELPEGQLFMAMELLEGLPLADALRLEPPLSVRELLVVLRETCAALAAAHTVGIVHRDVKPANIFLHRDRASGMIRPKILDFGVSKFAFLEESATHTGSLLGSPRYMSPEQARSAAQADLRSDVWSVGVILFEALTGVYPHEGDSFSNLVVAIATMPPRSIGDVAPTVPRALASLVEDCLRPRDQRLPSCEALAARIDDLLMTHDLAQVPCARGKGKKGVSRPSDFVVRSTSELGWSTEARARASLGGGAVAPTPPPAATPASPPVTGSMFDLPSATTNPIHTVDVPPPSQRTAEVTRPVATRPAFDRAKTTPMAPSASELAGLLARVAQANGAQPTGPSGTMGLGPTAGALQPPQAPTSPRSEPHRGGPPAGEQTQIHARRPQPPTHAPDAATRLMTLPDPDAATPMMSPSISVSGMPSPAPSSPYQPAMPSYEPRDHLVESVSTFGVERHRPTSMMPGTAPTGDAVASRRRNAGAVIAAASVAVVGLVVVLLLVVGRRGDEPAAASPVVPAAAVAPEAPAPLAATAGPDLGDATPPPPPAEASAVAPPAAPATAASAPSVAPAPSSAAPPPSASVKLGAPWPAGGPPRPAATAPSRKGKGCTKDSIDCLGSGL